MNRNYLILFLSLHFSILSTAQNSFTGEWHGQLEIPGLTLDLLIDLSLDGDHWQGTLDISQQNITDMALTDLQVGDSILSFSLPDVPGNASYKGIPMGDSITGNFVQAGRTLSLTFRRLDGVKEALIKTSLDQLMEQVDSLLDQYHVPGLSISVVRNGKVMINKGFGLADISVGRKVSPNTLFAIGSTTKAFTAAGLAILVDQQKLKWDEPIKTHLPDFVMFDNFASQEMTALDLITHRSGLPRHDLLWYGTDYSRIDLYKRLRYLEPTKSFRSTWQYQNLMYMTAGVTIEKLSGSTWEDFTRDKIFAPLDMKRTNFSVEVIKEDPDAAIGYRMSETDDFMAMDYRNIDAIGPAGSINSTSTDMAKWVKLLLEKGSVGGNSIITSEQVDFMHSPHMIVSTIAGQPEFTPAQYGTGWFIYDYRGSKVVQHGGNIDGFSALVFLLPEEKTGMTILVNKNGSRFPGALANYISDIILQNPEPIDWMSRVYGGADKKEEEDEEEHAEDEDHGQITGTSTSHDQEHYVGIYEHDAYQQIEISLEERSLRAKFNGLDMSMEHYHYDVFSVEDTTSEIDFKLQFHSDMNGSIAQLGIILEPSLDPILFSKKAPDQLSDPDFRKAVIGTYQVEDLKLMVKWKNEKLVLSPQGQPNFTLLPHKKNHFLAENLKGYSIEFIFTDKEVTHAVLYQPNGNFKANKVAPDDE